MSMIKRFTIIAVAFIIAFSNLTASAASTISSCSQGAKIFYINGVNKPIESQVAFDSSILSKEMRKKSISGFKTVWYLYNPSDSLIFDVFFELADQMSAQRNAGVADLLVQVGLAAWGSVSTLTIDEQTQIRAKVASTISQYSFSRSFTIHGKTFTTAGLVSQFKEIVAEELRNGTKVVLVPHSQGNMFANDVHTAIVADLPVNQSQGLAVANIANPAAKAATGLYVTVNQDRIILAARALAIANLARQPMTANTDAAGATDIDITGHGFIEVYLNYSLPVGTSDANSVAVKVLATIQQAINYAQDPVKDTNDGPITATMTWADYGDVDLHITEPSGAHVYYSEQIGAMGDLDMDNRYGFGPEHYYTSCLKELTTGDYIFGANYYDGILAQTATISIKTASGTQTTSVILPTPLGSYGDNNYVKLFNVNVTKNTDGTYKFVTTKL